MGTLATRGQLGTLAQAEPSLSTVTTEAVVWTAIVGCAVDAPNTLRKTAAGGWGNAGAVSTRAILSGAGYVEYTVQSLTGGQRICGLSNGNTDNNYTDVNFGAYLANAAWFSIENGTQVSLGAVALSDVLRVAVSAAGVVTYLKNGTVLRTSLATPTYPLLVDTAINTAGALIVGATLAGTDLGASGF